jgi:YVTN family beta-propeller protein
MASHVRTRPSAKETRHEAQIHMMYRFGAVMTKEDSDATTTDSGYSSSCEGNRLDMIAVSPDGKTLYVTSRDENQLLAVSAADLKVTAEVPTGDEPHGVSYRANSR